MQFENRQEAGKLLAERMFEYQTTDCIILAIPRGGVPVAREVAEVLHAPFHIIVTRKIGHPKQPEFSVCAVTEHNYVLCDEKIVRKLDQAWLTREIEREYQEAQRRRLKYSPDKDYVNDVPGKIIIVIDDGAATGLTLLAAIKEITTLKPQKTVVGVPVLSHEAYDLIAAHVDEVIALDVPNVFKSVGEFYKHFPQINDDDVTHLLL